MSIPSGNVKSTLLRPLATLTSGSDPSAAAILSVPRLSTVNEVLLAAACSDFARSVTRGLSTASIDIVMGVAPSPSPLAFGETMKDFTFERSTTSAIPLPE